MMNKILTTILAVARQYWKYKFRDVGMTLSTLLITSGMAIILSGPLWSILLKLDWINIPIELSFNSNGILGYGIVLVILGTSIGILRLVDLSKSLSAILIIHNGMEGMNTNSMQNELPKSFVKGRLEIISLYQSYQLHEGIVLSPERALNVINNLDQQIDTRLNGRSIKDVKLAYGGLAPIPLLVAAGYKISSRQECLVLDYLRGDGWHSLDELDDGENVSIHKPSKEIFKELAIIMPFSVDIAENQLPEHLLGKGYRFNLENGVRPDSLDSADKQKRIAKEFYSFCANLRAKHPNLERIHVFLASQASFSFRLGTVISASVLPSIIFYQYNVQKNKYGWSMVIKPGESPSILNL